MTSLISQDEAVARLQRAVKDAGGVGAYATKVGVSISFVSQLLHGHKPIQGKIGKDLRLKIHKKIIVSYESVNNDNRSTT